MTTEQMDALDAEGHDWLGDDTPTEPAPPVAEITMEAIGLDRVDGTDPTAIVWRVTLRAVDRVEAIRLQPIVFVTRTPPLPGQRFVLSLRHEEPAT